MDPMQYQPPTKQLALQGMLRQRPPRTSVQLPAPSGNYGPSGTTLKGPMPDLEGYIGTRTPLSNPAAEAQWRNNWNRNSDNRRIVQTPWGPRYEYNAPNVAGLPQYGAYEEYQQRFPGRRPVFY